GLRGCAKVCWAVCARPDGQRRTSKTGLRMKDENRGPAEAGLLSLQRLLTGGPSAPPGWRWSKEVRWAEWLRRPPAAAELPAQSAAVDASCRRSATSSASEDSPGPQPNLSRYPLARSPRTIQHGGRPAISPSGRRSEEPCRAT